MGQVTPRGDRPARFFFAMFQGGGNIPLILPIAARLVARGHEVRVLAGPGVRAGRLPVSARFRERVVATGATLVPFQDPTAHPLDEAPPPRGLARGWTPKQLATVSAHVLPFAWAPAWAEGTLAELRHASTDVLVADFVLLGALSAAEAAGVPAAALMHNVYNCPAPGLPTFGHGFLPARSPLGTLRDALYNTASRRIYRRDGLSPLNRARHDLGLPPLRAPLAQYHRAARVLVLASAAYDFPARRLPPNVRHVGTPLDDAGGRRGPPPGRRTIPARWSSSASARCRRGRGRRCTTSSRRSPPCRCARW